MLRTATIKTVLSHIGKEQKVTTEILTWYEQRIVEYYNQATEEFYIQRWNEDHLHFGLFEPGEMPEPGESLTSAAGLKRALERMLMVVVGPAQISYQDRVVDAGCGIGGAALSVARTYGCSVVGINVSQHQIDIARSKAARAGLNRLVCFEYADCSSHLPFPDGSIDVIINIESACHYSNRAKFLAECARILQPGGRLVASDWMAADTISPEDYQTYVQPICEAWFLSGLETQTTYTLLLRNAGFEVVEFVDFGEVALDNARIVDQQYRKLLEMSKRERLSPSRSMWLEQLRALSFAWLRGHFRLQRYFATKNNDKV